MELDEIKRLRARERIRKLKEIEAQKRKEIEEAEELVRESEREISAEEEFKRKVPINEVKAETLDQLEGIASQEAKQIWKSSRGLGTVETTGTAGTETLEAAVETSRPKEEETKTPEYGRAIERSRREQEPTAYQRHRAEEGESPAERYSRMERPGEIKEPAESYQKRRKGKTGYEE